MTSFENVFSFYVLFFRHLSLFAFYFHINLTVPAFTVKTAGKKLFWRFAISAPLPLILAKNKGLLPNRYSPLAIIIGISISHELGSPYQLRLLCADRSIICGNPPSLSHLRAIR